MEEKREKKRWTDSWIQIPVPFRTSLGTLCTFERGDKRIVEIKEAIQHPVLGIEKVIRGVAVAHVSNDAGRYGCRGSQAWGAWC